jgi:hypothetical protein
VTIAIQRAKKPVVLPEQAGSLVIKRKLSKFECNFGLDFSIFKKDFKVENPGIWLHDLKIRIDRIYCLW